LGKEGLDAKPNHQSVQKQFYIPLHVIFLPGPLDAERKKEMLFKHKKILGKLKRKDA